MEKEEREVNSSELLDYVNSLSESKLDGKIITSERLGAILSSEKERDGTWVEKLGRGTWRLKEKTPA